MKEKTIEEFKSLLLKTTSSRELYLGFVGLDFYTLIEYNINDGFKNKSEHDKTEREKMFRHIENIDRKSICKFVIKPKNTVSFNNIINNIRSQHEPHLIKNR